MKRIVMDTNFIMEVARNRIDLERELKRILEFPYETFMIEGTEEELNKIAREQKGKERETAKLAIILIRNIKTIPAQGSSVDEKLVNITDKDTIIATQDRELKKKIKYNKITIRQKKYLRLI